MEAIVQVQPAGDKPSGVTAKCVETDKVAGLWFSTKYPKAMSSGTRLKRLAFTYWRAELDHNGEWTAIELLRNYKN